MGFEDRINRMKSDIIKSVQEVLRIRSVKEASKPGAPFGEGINNALLYTLNLASSMGFKTKYIDGYMGYAEYGEGSEIVGVLGHLDVVPEGTGWMYPPFEGYIHNNRIYGRGAIDDKGPIIAALYGFKAIKDEGLKLNKKVRILFGTDEESGWTDIEKYLEKEVPPDIGFTPDGLFPVINAEKGAIRIELKKEVIRKSKGMIAVKTLKGGEGANIVPGLCICELKLKDMAKLLLKDTLELYSEKNNINLSFQEENDSYFIVSRGLSCHSSTPERGKNAISQMIGFLSQFSLGQNDVADFIKFLSKYVSSEINGKTLNIDCSDDISGSLTVNLGLISLDDEKASAVLDIRYPVAGKFENIINNIVEAAQDKRIDVSIMKHRKPLHIEKDSLLISTLMNSYKEVTGKEGYTISIGGQTYAKAFQNMAAFGPVFPMEDRCAHVPNEYIEIDNLIECAKIYGKAIYNLSR